MRPTVLLDVDGILADFVGRALTILERLCGHRYNPDELLTWEVFDGVREAHRRYKDAVYAEMAAAGGCAAIPVYPGAQEGVGRLCAVADVIIVTSPFPHSPTWMYERELWLHQHFDIHAAKIIHARHKYRIEGDIFVDDKHSHVVNWIAARRSMGGRAGILWSRPYNDGPNDEYAQLWRTNSWDNLFRVVERAARGAYSILPPLRP